MYANRPKQRSVREHNETLLAILSPPWYKYNGCAGSPLFRAPK
jgi:hypothetical protein